jgi:hypothetical protein
MNRHFRNRRVSCANPEVCSIRRRSVRKTLATAGLVRDNAETRQVGISRNLIGVAEAGLANRSICKQILGAKER